MAVSKPSPRRSPIRPWMIWTAVAVVLAVAAVLTTKVVPIADAEAAASGERVRSGRVRR